MQPGYLVGDDYFLPVSGHQLFDAAYKIWTLRLIGFGSFALSFLLVHNLPWHMYDNFRKNAAMPFLAAFYTFNIVYLFFRGQAGKKAFLLPNALA